MIRKVFTVTITLLLLLSGSIIGFDAVTLSLDEDHAVQQEINEAGGSERREFLDGTTDEYDLKESSKDGRSERRYEEGVKSAPVSDDRLVKTDHTEERGVAKYRDNIPHRSRSDHDTRAPIRIDGDEDFADLAVEENWRGDGTEEDPWLIEGYEIDGGGFGHSIFIGNVTGHFEVRGCHLHNASGRGGRYFRNSGLHLYNTTDGAVEENYIVDNAHMGIYLERTEDSVISDNTVLSNKGHGILLESSSGNELENNVVGDKLGYVDVAEETGSSETSGKEKTEDSVLVKLEKPRGAASKSGESILRERVDLLAGSVNGEVTRIYTSFNMAEIDLEDGVDVKTAVDRLSERDFVVEAEPNYLWEPMKVPNDPGYDSLWAMPTIQAEEAWEITTGSEDVVVAVLDTGIDHTHPDLKENMWTSEEGRHGYNAVNDSYHTKDDHGHGTHVAGTIGAVGDNEIGLVGMNWNVSMMALKFLDSGGRGTTGDAIACLEYVLERKKEGVNVVATSNSWGGAARSELLYRAIENHQEEGISFIAAAGNDGRDNDLNPIYPANYDLANVLSVAATDRNDELAGFSNYGQRTVDVGAPGVEINSTLLDNGYGSMSGTSMAVPHVSGLAALLASHNASYDQVNFKNVILSTAETYRSLEDKTLAGGRINALRALRASPEEINFWIRRPGSAATRGKETPVIVSLNDNVDPILDADVSVEFSTGEESIVLKDDGTGEDQMENDGHYSSDWTPRYAGEVTLTITAGSDEHGWEETKTITVEVKGGAGIHIEESEENVLSGNKIFNEEHGISLHSSGDNHILNNELYDNYETGLHLYRADENHIEGQTVRGGGTGLLLDRSHDNSLFKNTVSDTDRGIAAVTSEENLVHRNTASDNGRSIYLKNSYENDIINNTISDSDHGIYLYASEANDVTYNTLLKNEIGIYLRYSTAIALKHNSMEENGISISGHRLEDWNSHEIDETNRVNGKPVRYLKDQEGGTVSSGAGQVILVNCTDVTVEGQDVSRGSGGVILAHSEGNHIVGNNASGHNVGGIYLYWSDHNELTHNTASSNTYGIYILDSHQNELRYNNASNNEDGIYLVDSDNNLLVDNSVFYNEGNGIWLDGSEGSELLSNHVSNNDFRGIDLYRADSTNLENNILSDHSVGIDLAESVEVKMSNNRMVRDGIYIWGDKLEHWDSHTIDPSNTVNGRSVHYWKHEQREEVPEDAGQVILVNCTEITVKDQNVSYGTAGILLAFSDDNLLLNNDASNNDKGMRLYDSHDNEVRGNNVSDNSNEWFTLSYGIWLSSSSGNVLKENRASNNDGDGLYLRNSDDNTLVDNDAAKNNWRGVDLSRSDGNTVVESYAFDNRLGIRLQDSRDVTIENNEVQTGIELRNSRDVTLLENVMTEEGVSIWGRRKVYWNTHDIDTTNIVNDRPVHYWRDRRGGTVPEGAGQIILANCTDVTVEEQSMSGGRIAVLLGFSGSNTIKDNTLSMYDHAVYLRNSEDNDIVDNEFLENSNGLRLYGSNDNRLNRNNASENDNTGMDLWYSSNNTLANNTIFNNRRRGLRLQYSSENLLRANTASENSHGISLSNSEKNVLRDNVLSDNQNGISLSDCNDNLVKENIARKNRDSGIELRRSSTNTVEGNKIWNNSYAVYIGASDKNTFTGNNVSRNQEYGFYVSRSLDNLIYHNLFVDNEEQAFDDVDNYWDAGDPSASGKGGNYWSDHESVNRGDNIGDEPYHIQGNKNIDGYPWLNYQMVHPAGSFEVIVEDITAGQTPVLAIYEAEDVHDNPMEGVYEAEISLEGIRIDEELLFEDSRVEHRLHELNVSREYRVEVTIDGAADTDTFLVETAGLDQIGVYPESTTLKAGETVTFNAFAYDRFDNEIGDVTEETDWSIEDEAGGNWKRNEYRSESAGTWNVTGTYDEGVKEHASLTVEPGTVHAVRIEPSVEQTITAGEKIDFSAAAWDEYDNLITEEDREFRWENTNYRGWFRRTEAGDYNVTASYENETSEPTMVTVEEAEKRPLSFAALWLGMGVLISVIVFKRKKKVSQL